MAFLCVGIGLVGFGYAAVRAQARMNEVLPRQLEGHDVGLTGKIGGVPLETAHGTRFRFEVEETDAHLAHFPSTLQLDWPASSGAATRAVLKPGERWYLRVRLKRPHGMVNFSLRDEEAAWLAHGVRAVGKVSAASRAQRLERSRAFSGSMFDAYRAAKAARIGEVLGAAPYLGIVTALAIGEQGLIDDAQWQVLRRTGTNHLVAVSGLHIGLAAGLCGWLAAFCWRSAARFGRALPLRWPAPKVAVLGAWAGAGIYAALAGFNVPAQRAWWMVAAAGIAYLSGRAWPRSALLAWALGCVLLLDPWAVVSPGFWLSYTAAAAIFLAVSAGTARGTVWRRVIEYLRSTLRVQYAVTLALVPVTVFWFAQIACLAPLANLVAVPWIGLLATPCALAGAILPAPFDVWPLRGAHLAVEPLMHGLEHLAEVPYAQVWLPVPGGFVLLAAVCGTVWLLLPRGWPLRWAAPLAWLPFGMPALVPDTGVVFGAARLTALDVGQGPAVLVETGRHRLLFGAGSGPAGVRVVVPFLRAQGVRRLDTVVDGYSGASRVSSLKAVLAAIEARSVLTAGRGERLSGVKALPCAAGQRWRWDGVAFEILWPVAPRRPGAQSCVLRVATRGGSVLLTGDLDARAERGLRASAGAALAADMLLMPRQGSPSASTELFLDSVAPHLALFQVAYANRFGQPHASVRARLTARRIAVARTDLDGALRWTLPAAPDTAAAVPERWREAHRRYWTDR